MKLNKEGQSTLEFIFSFAIVFSFIFFFFKIALNYTNGYLLHYANFMASRTYLVHDINSNNVSGGDGPALKEAKAIFATYNIDSAFVSSTKATLKANDPEFSGLKVYVGTIAEKVDSFSFTSFIGNIGSINFVSESFLGREPIRSECLAQICEAMKEVGANCLMHSTFFDNGC